MPRQPKEFDTRSEADDSRHVMVAGLELIGECFRLVIVFAPGAGAPLPDASQPRLRPLGDIEQPGPERTEKSLVPWSGQQIDLPRFNVHGEVPRGLRCIDQQQRRAGG